MILLWLFCITFTFTITTQYETVANVNTTNVLDILEAIQRISEDRNVIILSMKEIETPRSPNETTIIYDDESNYVESENDIEDLKYHSQQDDTQSPKMKNILRWLPKKRRITEKNREKAEKAVKKDKQKYMGRAQNAERVAEIVSVIENNYLASSFMYNEIKRIQRDRNIIDDTREMILRVESSTKKGYKQSVIDCYNKAKAEAEVEAAVKAHKTNNLVINIVKDSPNDGVN